MSISQTRTLSTRARTLGTVALAIALSAVGFILLFKLFRIVSPQEYSDVTLNITLQAKNRPISEAEIWLARPENKLLGLTRENGKAKIQTQLKKGKIAVIEARGATFRISKDLPIPNIDRYEMNIHLDETELNLGRMTLESRSLDAKERNALNQYEDTVKKITKNEIEKRQRNVSVVLAKEQPPISQSAKTFLAKARKAFQQEADKKKYTLQRNNISSIRLRILRSQNQFLEVVLFDSKNVLKGAKLVDIENVNAKTVSSILVDAAEWKYDNGKWPVSTENLKSRFWHIRKRPVDSIQTYLNGEPLVLRENNEVTTSLLPQGYAPETKWQLAAVGQSGLIVIKELEASQFQRPLVWQWPEWLMSQKSSTTREQ